jgi:monoamine oxidase
VIALKGKPMAAEAVEADACVIGAGSSGTVVAYSLQDVGLEVLVLEACDRVGGRVWNREMADGIVVSMGGDVAGKRAMTGPSGCPVSLGMTTYPQFEDGEAWSDWMGATTATVA